MLHNILSTAAVAAALLVVIPSNAAPIAAIRAVTAGPVAGRGYTIFSPVDVNAHRRGWTSLFGDHAHGVAKRWGEWWWGEDATDDWSPTTTSTYASTSTSACPSDVTVTADPTSSIDIDWDDIPWCDDDDDDGDDDSSSIWYESSSSDGSDWDDSWTASSSPDWWWTESSSSTVWAASPTPTPAVTANAWTRPTPTQDPWSPSPSPSSGGNGGGAFSGEATFFYQAGNPGNCGEYNSDSTYLIAVRPEWYKQGQNCGKMITVTAANGKTISAPIMDSCPSCDTRDSLDMSTGLWNAFGYPEDDGIFQMTWRVMSFCDKDDR